MNIYTGKTGQFLNFMSEHGLIVMLHKLYIYIYIHMHLGICNYFVRSYILVMGLIIFIFSLYIHVILDIIREATLIKRTKYGTVTLRL
jgi:hypothetical protein